MRSCVPAQLTHPAALHANMRSHMTSDGSPYARLKRYLWSLRLRR
jgi:hypothetical protein